MAARRRRSEQAASAGPGRVRIIAGAFRGRTIPYSGDPRIRPMKDRVREAVFSLVGGTLHGYRVLDVFAGTGALGFEALSRGAQFATFVERHWPTCQLLMETVKKFGLTNRATVVHADAFFWMQHDWRPDETRTILFCSPPYAFYATRRDELLALIEGFLARAAPQSLAVVESDTTFDVRPLLPQYTWIVRDYPPARVALGAAPSSTIDGTKLPPNPSSLG